MENASKALIMAAEVLIGIMIISIATYLFNLFADYSKESYQQIEDTQIAEFNNTFLKFESSNIYTIDGAEVSLPFACTIHDIAGLANFAQKYNLQNELLIQNGDSFTHVSGNLNNTLYVQIDFLKKKNIETYSSKDLADLIKQYDLKTNYDAEIKKTTTNVRYFICKCQVNGETRRVNYVTFTEFSANQYKIMEEILGN